MKAPSQVQLALESTTLNTATWKFFRIPVPCPSNNTFIFPAWFSPDNVLGQTEPNCFSRSSQEGGHAGVWPPTCLLTSILHRKHKAGSREMQDSREGSTVKHITCVVELNQPLPSTFCNYLYDKPKHTTTYPLGKIQKKYAHLQMSSAGRVFVSLPCIFISKRTLNQIKKTSWPYCSSAGN